MRAPQFTYANVMSSIAVFLALGGTSYAVAKNSVGEKQLKTNAVTSPKIKDGSVATADLAPGTQLSGPRGPRGEQGPPGSSGRDGLVQAYRDAVGGPLALPNSEVSRVTAARLRLPAGTYAIDFTGHAYSNAEGTWVDCYLRVGEAGVNHTAGKVGASPDSTVELALALTDVLRLPAESTVDVACGQRGTTHDVRMNDLRLRALTVAAVDEQ